MTKKLILIDEETGEVEDFYGEYKTIKQIEAQSKYKANKQRQTFNVDFTWILFKYGEELFPEVAERDLTRLIYLSTFCDYTGKLPPKRTLKLKLKLSDKYWSIFLKNMKDNNIVIEDESSRALYLNKDFFIKGDLTASEEQQAHTRLFCNFIRDVYESCDDVKSISQIAYLYRLIPFVNRRTNMVCYNPEEQDPEKVYPITLGEFCDMVGYNKKNARRLAKDLLSLKCNGQNLIGFFVTDLNQSTWKIIVNPRMYYGGQNDKIYKEQVALLIDYNPQEALDVNNT